MKKVASFLLITAMILTILTISVFADDNGGTEGSTDGFEYTSDGSYCTITDYNGSDKVITIPETLGGLPVTSIGDNAFYYCSSLTSITIPKGVTSIGNSVFKNCSSLAEIIVAEDNEIFTSVNGVLFNKDKTALICYPEGKTDTAYTIPSSVTSIADSAFYDCSSLNSIAVPSGVNSIGEYAFSGCSSLESLTIPSGITSIGRFTFSSCLKLTSMIIPSGVESIGQHAFYGCSALASVTLPNTVKTIGASAFSSCYSLADINIPNGMTTIEHNAFSNCYKLTSITIPNSVTTIDAAAFSGSGLTSITIPSSVTSIENSLFQACSALTSVTIPGSVTSIGYNAFHSCSNLTDITIPSSVTSIGQYAFQNCRNIASITIPDGVASIGDYTFSNCSNLNNITIPKSVKKVNPNAFKNCSKLENVYYGGSSSEWNKIIVYYGNTALTKANIIFGAYAVTYHADGAENIPEVQTKTRDVSLTLSSTLPTKSDCTFLGWATSTGGSVVYAAGASYTENADLDLYAVWGEKVDFEYTNHDTYCEITKYIGTDTEVTIPETINGLPVTSIGNSTFKDCSNLKSVKIPNSVTSIGEGAFNGCESLAGITIPNSVSSIGYGAFRCCCSLTSITIPSSVTSIGDYAFSHCSRLTKITVDADNANYSSVDGVLFDKDKTELLCYPTGKTGTSYTIPNSVNSIGVVAFHGCSSIMIVMFPSSVTAVDEYAFFGCSSLKNVYYGGSSSDWKAITIEDGNDSLTNAYIITNYVPDANAPTITVSTESGRAGDEVTVSISVSKNSGIAGLAFNLNFDNTKLTPVSVQKGDILDTDLTTNIDSDSGIDVTSLTYVRVIYANPSEFEDDGVICTVKFKVKEGVDDGFIPLTFTIGAEKEGIVDSDGNRVVANIVGGGINVESVIYGDLNGDGKITSSDAVILAQYLAEWSVTIDLKAADVNGDGEITSSDAVLLAQYLAEWNVTLGKK